MAFGNEPQAPSPYNHVAESSQSPWLVSPSKPQVTTDCRRCMRREMGHSYNSQGMGGLSILETLFFNIMRISFALHPDQSQTKSMTKGQPIYGFMYLRRADGILCILTGRAMVNGQVWTTPNHSGSQLLLCDDFSVNSVLSSLVPPSKPTRSPSLECKINFAHPRMQEYASKLDFKHQEVCIWVARTQNLLLTASLA